MESRLREQGRRWRTEAMRTDRVLEEREDGQFLQSTADDRGQHALDESTAVLAVGPEGALAPDDRSAYDALGVIVHPRHELHRTRRMVERS